MLIKNKLRLFDVVSDENEDDLELVSIETDELNISVVSKITLVLVKRANVEIALEFRNLTYIIINRF